MIYIATYHSDINYGAALQSYALQTYLKKLGYDSEFIDIKYSRKTQAKDLRSCLNGVYNKLNSRAIYEGRKNFYDFFADNHKVTRVYNGYEDLVNNPPEGRVYISGSDQVFNPYASHPEFFLNYGDRETRRISYAASIGVNQIPADKKDEFYKKLQAFDAISLREESSAVFLKGHYNGKININIDPSMLIDKYEWNSVRHEYKMDKPYILVYAIYKPKWLGRKLFEIHKKTKLDVVLLSYGGIRPIYRNKTIFDAGPAEFLSLVDNAEMVISSSYHGCVFSAIYEKPFYAVVNPQSPDRITSFLKLFDLESRVLNMDTIINFSVNYSNFQNRLNEERARSKDYLLQNIEV